MKTVDTNGMTIVYQDYGEGYPLLLIHGALVSRHSWRPQINALAQRFHVIAPDLRGHGGSSITRNPYSVRLFAQDHIALMDALSIERALICGHSLGGMIAQEIAITYPERVAALVLAETSYSTSATPWERLGTQMAHLMFRVMSVEQIARTTASASGRHNPAVKDFLLKEISAHSEDKDNYLNIWQAVFSFDSRDRLADIDCLALVVVGELNRQTHHQGNEIHRKIRGSMFGMVPGAGHMCNWDNAGFFNGAVGDFLDGAAALSR